MSQRDNILQELKDLESSLVNVGFLNVYQVPAGYFDELPAEVLRRIRSIEAGDAQPEIAEFSPLMTGAGKINPYIVPSGYFDGLADRILRLAKAADVVTAAEEISQLSPLLAGISRKMPYSHPAAYFDEVAETALFVVSSENESAEAELKSISPLLSGLKKETPYSVPDGYFNESTPANTAAPVEETVKVIPFGRQKWFRYAAAAVVTGIIAISAFLFTNRNGSSVGDATQKEVHGLVKNISTEDIDNFVNTVDDGGQAIAMTQVKKEKDEVRDLIKDIPDEELQKFLDETKNATADDNADELFAN